MQHRDIPAALDAITHDIVGAALDVHRALGPGLLERPYRDCLARALEKRGRRVEREIRVDIEFEGETIPSAFRIDLRVDGLVLVEVKAIAQILDVHRAQLRTYLKLSGARVGLLINFNVEFVQDGIIRVVSPIASSRHRDETGSAPERRSAREAPPSTRKP